jgi:fatty acid synthase
MVPPPAGSNRRLHVLQAQAGALAMLAHPATVLAFVPLVPAAFMLFGVLLMAAMCALKWAVVGRARFGVHR